MNQFFYNKATREIKIIDRMSEPKMARKNVAACRSLPWRLLNESSLWQSCFKTTRSGENDQAQCFEK